MRDDAEIIGPNPELHSEPQQTAHRPVRGSLIPLLLSAGAAIVGCASAAYPMFVIRPFRHQGASELALALAMKQMAPPLTIVCAAIVAICLIAFWRRFPAGRRVLASFFAVVACGSVWLARFNLYEIMFHPMGAPSVEEARTAKIDPDDMVLAVNVNRSARAYPIRTMGYHHIANDWVGGEPIVATY